MPAPSPKIASLDQAKRGYHVPYREDQVNHCPGCGRSHWLIGRLLAECAFCATALPLDERKTTGVGVFRVSRHRDMESRA